MPQVDEFGGVRPDNRLSDSSEITNNDGLLMRQMLGILGLDVDRDGKLYRRKLTIDGVEYASRPSMSYEGAVKLLQEFLVGYMSNLASYTNLSDAEARTVVKSFNRDLAYWMWSNRERYRIDESECHFIINGMSDMVFFQLKRSVGSENLIVQVMGNTQKQYLYQSRGEEQQPQEASMQRRPWYHMGGFFGR